MISRYGRLKWRPDSLPLVSHQLQPPKYKLHKGNKQPETARLINLNYAALMELLSSAAA